MSRENFLQLSYREFFTVIVKLIIDFSISKININQVVRSTGYAHGGFMALKVVYQFFMVELSF